MVGAATEMAMIKVEAVDAVEALEGVEAKSPACSSSCGASWQALSLMACGACRGREERMSNLMRKLTTSLRTNAMPNQVREYIYRSIYLCIAVHAKEGLR
jgi:hypothetical protein